MIQTINVSLSYNNGVQALRNVSVRIASGEFVFIVGTTGSGKSGIRPSPRRGARSLPPV